MAPLLATGVNRRRQLAEDRGGHVPAYASVSDALAVGGAGAIGEPLVASVRTGPRDRQILLPAKLKIW